MIHQEVFPLGTLAIVDGELAHTEDYACAGLGEPVRLSFGLLPARCGHLILHSELCAGCVHMLAVPRTRPARKVGQRGRPKNTPYLENEA